ncbi:tobacco nucleolin [Striga asiatica]|uniref:Tobacco nucleolin n=1 Tax=Striga asiatica TaxID=4170 RepID=A0A5A7RKT4_STRAF|nr:tobacco nucleolin [Striga asiatica]
MGKSSKKSASKVSAPAVVAAPVPTKPLKKGKREAEDVAGKEVVSAKKQKVEEKKNVLKPEKKAVKVESSSEEDTSSESEHEPKVKVAAKNGHVDSNPKKPSVAAKNGHLASKKKAESSDDSDSSEDESSSDDEVAAVKKAPAPLAKKGPAPVPAKKEDESSDDSDSSSDDDSSDEDVAAAKKATPAVSHKKSEASTKKKDESSSEDSDSSEDESDTEEDAPTGKKAPAPPVNKAPVAAIKKKDDSSSDDEESSDEDVPAKNHLKAVAKKDESSEESESDDSSSSEEDVPKTAAVKTTIAETKQAKDEDSDDESSEESDDEEPQKKKIKQSGAPNAVKSSKGAEEDDSSSEEESSDEDEPTKTQGAKKDTDVEMIDATASKANAEKGFDKSPKTPTTPKEQSTGSRTLFVANLPFSVEQADVENFFKPAGEVVDVRFAVHPDNSLKGFGHVDFATAEEAQKAVNELNGKDLLGRALRLDLARERGAYIPRSGDSQSFQKGQSAQGLRVFVRGFDRNDGEDQIRNSLKDHFGSCGEIARVSIPQDPEGGVKGIAYIDFKDSDAFNQALELNGSEFGEGSLTVEEARSRGKKTTFNDDE